MRALFHPGVVVRALAGEVDCTFTVVRSEVSPSACCLDQYRPTLVVGPYASVVVCVCLAFGVRLNVSSEPGRFSLLCSASSQGCLSSVSAG